MSDEKLLQRYGPSEEDSDPRNFSLAARPKSDIYCSPLPPNPHIYNAPTALEWVKKSAFLSARVFCVFRAELHFDQAGLLFVIPTESTPAPDAHNSDSRTTHPAYIKAGVEVNEGAPYLSVISRPAGGWCDWSLVPLDGSEQTPCSVSFSIELTRFKNALMVWSLGEERRLMRKVPWVFLGDEEEIIGIGVYAARPDPDNVADGQDLIVDYRGLKVENAL